MLPMLGVLALFCAFLIFAGKKLTGHEELEALLIKQLAKHDAIADLSTKATITHDTVVYVLGGSQESQHIKYQIVSELCQRGYCGTVLLMSEPEITEYDPVRGRNLTKDEWSLKTLQHLGVERRHIEFLPIKKHLFGTLTEAQGLAELSKERGYTHLLLVTSEYHTKRTLLTFNKMFEHRNTVLTVVASNEPVGLIGMGYEYVKLLVYEYLVLPMCTARPTVLSRPREIRRFPVRTDRCRSLQNNRSPEAGSLYTRQGSYRDCRQLSNASRHGTMCRNTAYTTAGLLHSSGEIHRTGSLERPIPA